MLHTDFGLPVNLWGSLDPRWQTIMICLASILIAGIFLVSLISRSHPPKIDLASLLSLALMGGILVLILLSFPIFLWGAWRGEALNFRAIFLALIIGLCMGALILNLPGLKPYTGSAYPLLALGFLFCGLAFLRLVFIRDLVMPPYSDSVEHYQIINDLLHPERPPQAFYNFARITSRYYHFGFHTLAGWTSALSASSIQETMLVLGQILQAVIPVALFFPVRDATKSGVAGLWSVVLAGLAWRLPAFASNWGKYPALTGIVTFLFMLSILQLAGKSGGGKGRMSLLIMAIAGVLVSSLSHVRSLLLLVIACGGWWIGGRILNARMRWKMLMLIACASIGLWAGIQVARNPELTFMLEPYLRSGFYPSLLVFLLVPFGFRYLPRPMISALLFLLMLIICTLAPLPGMLQRLGYQTLLDRPFGQMVLFLPLSLIGGIGLAGLGRGLTEEWTGNGYNRLRRRLWVPVSLLLCLAVTQHALRYYDFSPSPCCQLASEDDLAAFDWMEHNLPADAVILIASNRTPSRSYGVDGGIWITPLTGYRTEKFPYNALLDSPTVLEQVCAKDATHIYAGGTAARFSVERMESRPDWYKRLFTHPGAYVYEIHGCSTAP